MNARCYTNLWEALVEAGVSAERTGEASEFHGRQVCIEIHDEQNSGRHNVSLYFNIDENGDESFVCQE